MNKLLKTLTWLAGIAAALYIAVCCYFYFEQDSLIFHEAKLSHNHKFSFAYPFKEYSIKSGNDTLSGVLFKADSAKGLIFFLHGNAGNADDWGDITPEHTAMGYDMFVLDYPGFGKSTGHISSEADLLQAVQTAYDTLKNAYQGRRIIIMGFSIGTGPAAWLAANNKPDKLVLLAPYYSFIDLAKNLYPFLPSFISKYQLNTYSYIEKVKAPIVIFHGDADGRIYYQSSLKLKQHFKPGDRLIILKGQRHNGIDKNEEYIKRLPATLN
ncbi:alpha/beta fold hydrolase [Mucilaginibacter sp. JRF]|uniref:alpha/beta hydrolase n=1 Tax=Mucilaginibacter sp. JRF TaxID=2780088 RepID=UPI00187F7B77|nr:alpha/beta fold hydrolase [Mucilaginibacter sp. JRF]MBE9585236.1 alpha/beta fold hydrolase [Mucilaginibacter sp. JRF]